MPCSNSFQVHNFQWISKTGVKYISLPILGFLWKACVPSSPMKGVKDPQIWVNSEFFWALKNVGHVVVVVVFRSETTGRKTKWKQPIWIELIIRIWVLRSPSVLSCPHLCGNSWWGKDCGAVQKVWVLVVRWPRVADVKMGRGRECGSGCFNSSCDEGS